VFICTYADLCRDRRRHARLRLNPAFDLNLNLNLNLFPSLNLNLFLLQKPNASSLASKSVLVLYLYLNLNLSLFLPRFPPPGQSPVRYPHGRIVVPAVPDHYIWFTSPRASAARAP
jgi:hypothetical protein